MKRIVTITGIALVLCMALPWGGRAMAGMLMIEHYGLTDAATGVGFAMEASVLATHAEGIDVEVTRLWEAPGREAHGFAEGSRHTVRIYTGIVWGNPRVSPIDRRLRGSGGDIREGLSIVLVPYTGQSTSTFEPMPPTDQTRRALDVTFSADRAREYAEASPKDVLLADTGQPDLAAHAYAALVARGLLTTADVVESTHEDRPSWLLSHHVRSLAPEARAAFLAEARGLVMDAPQRAAALLRAASAHLSPASAGPTAELAELFDPTDTDDLTRLRDAKVQLMARLSDHPDEAPALAAGMIPFMVTYMSHRFGFESMDQDMGQFAGYLEAGPGVEMARALVERMADTAYAGSPRRDQAGFDMLFFKTAEAIVLAHPVAAHAATIGLMDPMYPEDHHARKAVMDAMLAMSTSIALADSGALPLLCRIIEPRLKHRTPVGKDALDAWREAAGSSCAPEPASRVETTLTPGSALYTPEGIRIAMGRAGEGGAYTLTLKPSATMGETSAFDAHERPSAEGTLEGAARHYTARLVSGTDGGAAMEVTIDAPEAARPALMTEPELYKLATQIAEAAGFTEYEDHYYKRWDGVFEYEAANTEGTHRTFVLSGYTGKVIREE